MAPKSKKCLECGEKQPVEQFEYEYNGKKQTGRKCNECRRDFGRVNKKQTHKRDLVRAPIIGEYYENGWSVKVLPPSAGHII